jgi:hypothetical protein
VIHFLKEEELGVETEEANRRQDKREGAELPS